MPAVPHWVKVRLSVVAAIAAVLSYMAVSPTPIRSQEPPSIVGSTPLYGLSGTTGWINSTPLTAKQLKGKVVLVDFLGLLLHQLHSRRSVCSCVGGQI